MADHFTQLLEWRRNELAVRGLAKLPLEFYAATTAYLAELRRSYESELRENPSGRKGDISRQTYQRAIQVAGTSSRVGPRRSSARRSRRASAGAATW